MTVKLMAVCGSMSTTISLEIVKGHVPIFVRKHYAVTSLYILVKFDTHAKINKKT